MKKLLCLLSLCTMLLSAAPLAANAVKLDMGSFTCKEFIEMDEDDISMLIFWYDGYFSAKTGNNVLDTNTLEKAMEVLGEHCAKNPNDNVLNILSD